jgi:hypothetical protein
MPPAPHKTSLKVKSIILLLAVMALGVVSAVLFSAKDPLSLEYCAALPRGRDATFCYVAALSFETEEEFFLALDQVESIVADPGQLHFKLECHEVTHELGKLAAQKFPDYRKYYKTTPDKGCVAGLQHGLLEIELSSVSNADLGASGLDFCAEKMNFTHRCTHFLGHVARVREKSSTLEVAMTFVRKVCGGADSYSSPDSAFLTFRCYDGAFMEESLQVRRGVINASLNPDPLAWCARRREEDPVEASACVYQLVQLTFESLDTERALNSCGRHLASLSRKLHEMCILGLTNYLSVVYPVSERTATSTCSGIGDLESICRAGLAIGMRSMAGYEAMKDTCKLVSPGAYDDCMVLAGRPLPIEYPKNGVITDVATEVGALHENSPTLGIDTP